MSDVCDKDAMSHRLTLRIPDELHDLVEDARKTPGGLLPVTTVVISALLLGLNEIDGMTRKATASPKVKRHTERK